MAVNPSCKIKCAVHNDPMITAADIRRARAKLDETQTEFAHRLGVDQSTIHRWEQEAPAKPLLQKFLSGELKRWLPKNGRAT